MKSSIMQETLQPHCHHAQPDNGLDGFPDPALPLQGALAALSPLEQGIFWLTGGQHSESPEVDDFQVVGSKGMVNTSVSLLTHHQCVVPLLTGGVMLV